MRIVYSGGGSGGHLYPLVAVNEKLKQKFGEKEPVEPLFLGPRGEMENRIIKESFIPSVFVMAGKLRRYFSLKNVTDILKTIIGIIQSLWYLLVFMPDVVFAKGGYASFPVVFAAWLYRIPVVLHESDVVPGMSNRVMSRFAKVIAVSFKESESFLPIEKTIVTGNPVREEVLQGSKEEGQKVFHLNPQIKTILIIGGSLGAQAINEAILSVLQELVRKYQVIHITGINNYRKAKEEAGRIGIKVGRDNYYLFPYLDKDLAHAYAVADLVISRAGANVISEIAAWQIPSILIPIPESANNHQVYNATEVARAGAAIMLTQGNLGKKILLNVIERVLSDKEENYALRERIAKFYCPDATEKIVESILNVSQ